MEEKIKDTYIIDYQGYKNVEVTAADMPNSMFRDMAEICGVDVAVKILKYMVGNTIVVPTCGFEKIEKRLILQNYNYDSLSIQRIARKLSISERAIRNIISRYVYDVNDKGQQCLFDKNTMKNATQPDIIES